MLSRQGIILTDINEYNILQAYKQISDKQAKAQERLKRDQSSISPKARQSSNQFADVTNYVTKLSALAKNR